jgi:hypothetical protein
MEPDADGQPEPWDSPAADGLRPVGPDDDPEFLRELGRRFRDGPTRDGDL